ncbi:peptidyl-prolyl cis-trans isomerase [Jeotgalibacillus marinus]|uniref:peptidylprolyl isomerase n=1 Tax=Jeotgalibacillus marinus TaxID=86667 RepID=A0ABV3Q6D0_9BACL
MLTELRNRRLKAKPLVYIIGFLLVTNFLTLIAWVSKDGTQDSSEIVATVGEEEISRQEWLHAIELSHGKEVLQNLINQSVMEQSAQEYGLEISQEELDQEFSLLRPVLNVNDQASLKDEEVLKEQLKTELILEKLITSEVDFSESDLQAYYEENKSQYSIPVTYRLSQIVVADEDEAQQVMGELKNNSSFGALARERSIDPGTASLGGELGYVLDNSTSVDENVLTAIRSLKTDEWSQPVQTEDGFVISFLHEKTEGAEFSFEDVKSRIERQLALEQLNVPVTAESFWGDFPISWFYGSME